MVPRVLCFFYFHHIMQRIKPGVDIILDVLNAVKAAKPSPFIESLLFQYHERGGLSRKQLEGLYGKASKLESISPAKLATLEAIIKKKPTRFKSTMPDAQPLYVKDESVGQTIKAILDKNPLHKRVLFLRTKYEHNEPLSATELAELQKFNKLLR